MSAVILLLDKASEDMVQIITWDLQARVRRDKERRGRVKVNMLPRPKRSTQQVANSNEQRLLQKLVKNLPAF